MLTWFVYDITDDKIRRKIIKIAEKKGLYRVQKSVFLGNIEKNALDEIVIESETILNIKEGSLYIFPMCERDFKEVKLIGLAFDKMLVNDEIKALFF